MLAGSQHADNRHCTASNYSYRHGTSPLAPANAAADLEAKTAAPDAFEPPSQPERREHHHQWLSLPPSPRSRLAPPPRPQKDPLRRQQSIVPEYGDGEQPHQARRRRRLRQRHSRRTSSMAAPWQLGRALGVAAASALALLAPAVGAVQVPFRDCLPETYRLRTPTPLQWTPLHAEAYYDTAGKSHNLQLTVWGNVSGAFNPSDDLPPAGDPAWSNPNATLGKIVRNPEPDRDRPMATTLISSVNVLTYRPYRHASDFCETSLDNAACPLGPVFDTSSELFPYNLPSVNMTHDFWSSYAFTSFSAEFSIIYGDSGATKISCVAATITPDLGSSLTWMLTVFPVAILTVVGLATIYASICSACGSADIFYWSSNFGRQPDLLRLVTPGFGDCLQYIQFVVLTGALSLDYPGFYQPITSKVGWSALMFNSSLVSHEPAWETLVDGIYITNGTFGLERMGQLTGMPTTYDMWAGMIVWLLVLVASITFIFQVGFLSKWLYRHFRNTPEEDLRSKNVPFSIGTLFRIVFGYFMLPVVALSSFQLVVAGSSPPHVTIAAVISLLLVIIFIARVFVLILRTKPRVNLFDDLRTLLLYGPLYNTYSDGAAPYALVPLVLTLVRGIAIGAVQPSGIAQLVLLAICEIIQVMTIHAFRPFHRSTSMNAYHTGFAVFRFVSVMLMVAFVPSLGVDDGSKGWIGYVVLFLHAIVLVLGFFLNALQKMVEVTAYVMGVGAEGSQSRGGFMRIFGARQLQRRMTRKRHHTGPSRASHLSSTAMLAADEHTRNGGYVMPDSHLRSSSAASLGGLLQSRHMSASVVDSELYSPVPGTNSFPPGTPAANSGFSFPMSGRPSIGGGGIGVPLEAADPYYRPPRPRREFTGDTSSGIAFTESPTASPRRHSQIAAGAAIDSPEAEPGGLTRGGTRPGYGSGTIQFMPRTDYSTREVDFYYRVRGPALNSDGPGRKLGTGPADPTGPMASASSWVRGLFSGGKSKEKSKGFEVVRSSRMPPAMMRAAAADYAEETPPEGIPVAMGVIRSGPIESDDDDNANGQGKTGQLVDVSAEPRDSAEGMGLMGGQAESPRRKRTASGDKPPGGAEARPQSQQAQAQPFSDVVPEGLVLPEIPRKSSRRESGADKKPVLPFTLASPPPLPRTSSAARSREELPRLLTRHPSTHQPPSRSNPSGRSVASSSVASRLPFERSASQRDGPSSTASSVKDFPMPGSERDHYDGAANFGHVRRHNASLVDLDFDADGRGHHGLMSRSAEIVNEDSVGSRDSSLRR